MINDHKGLLLNAFIANVYQAADIFCLKLRGVAGKRFLLLHPQHRFNLSDKVLEWQTTPFVSILRKHLRNKRILAINQYFFDRIVCLGFSDGVELVCEIIPRGVLALIKNGSILAASQYTKMKDREILVGSHYKYPPEPPKNPIEIPVDEFSRKLMGPQPLFKNLMKLGIGPKYALEVCKRLGLNYIESVRDHQQVIEIRKALEGLFSEVLSSRRGFVYLKDKIPVFFSPIPLSFTSECEEIEFESFDDAIDYYFGHSMLSKFKEKMFDGLHERRKRLLDVIERQREMISQLDAKINRLRKTIEVIYDNYSLIDSVLQTIQKAKDLDRRDWSEIRERIVYGKTIGIESAAIVDSIQNDGTIVFRIGDISFSANYRESINAIASKLYQRIKKLGEKLAGAKIALEKSLLELQNLDREVEKMESKVECLVYEPKYEWYHGFRWFLTSKNALLVVAGKDAQTNETLLKKYRNENDLILHAEIPGGAVVLLKDGRLRAGKEDIEEAAIYAASYSKAWKEGLAAVDVFYTRADNISLSPPSGTYLEKGAFIVLKKEVIKNVKLELAVGMRLSKDGNSVSVLIQSVPSTIAEALLDHYCIIRPGKQDKNAVAKFIHKYLVEKLTERAPNCDERIAARVIKIEKVSELIPGPSEIEFKQ